MSIHPNELNGIEVPTFVQVQGQTVASVKGNGSDASVPETDVKRMRFGNL